MIDQIKELRVKLDGLAQLTKELKPQNQKFISFDGNTIINSYNSKEIEKAVDSLYLAKAWLGKLLGELGTENPYGSGYKTKEDIVPTQDVSRVLDEVYSKVNENINLTINGLNWKESNHIEKVDWLRSEIETLIKIIKDIVANDPISRNLSREFNIARTNSYNHLCEAKFWLGFELERIKEEK